MNRLRICALVVALTLVRIPGSSAQTPVQLSGFAYKDLQEIPLARGVLVPKLGKGSLSFGGETVALSALAYFLKGDEAPTFLIAAYYDAFEDAQVLFTVRESGGDFTLVERRVIDKSKDLRRDLVVPDVGSMTWQIRRNLVRKEPLFVSSSPFGARFVSWMGGLGVSGPETCIPNYVWMVYERKAEIILWYFVGNQGSIVRLSRFP